MTPSQLAWTSSSNDPILTARLEAISQLAESITERVAVMDGEFNLIYANRATSFVQDSETPSAGKCYQAFAHRNEPCETCPAIKIFQDPSVSSVSCSSEENAPACGMRQTFPLRDKDGHVVSMVVLSEQLSQSTRFYALTAAGRAQLVAEIDHWTRLSRGVALILDATA